MDKKTYLLYKQSGLVLILLDHKLDCYRLRRVSEVVTGIPEIAIETGPHSFMCAIDNDTNEILYTEIESLRLALIWSDDKCIYDRTWEIIHNYFKVVNLHNGDY